MSYLWCSMNDPNLNYNKFLLYYQPLLKKKKNILLTVELIICGLIFVHIHGYLSVLVEHKDPD
jgi:hypothetical protein